MNPRPDEHIVARPGDVVVSPAMYDALRRLGLITPDGRIDLTNLRDLETELRKMESEGSA